MALLLHGGLLGGVAGEAGGVDGSGEGAWTLATPPGGFLAASETGERAHLLLLLTSSTNLRLRPSGLWEVSGGALCVLEGSRGLRRGTGLYGGSLECSTHELE